MSMFASSAAIQAAAWFIRVVALHCCVVLLPAQDLDACLGSLHDQSYSATITIVPRPDSPAPQEQTGGVASIVRRGGAYVLRHHPRNGQEEKLVYWDGEHSLSVTPALGKARIERRRIPYQILVRPDELFTHSDIWSYRDLASLAAAAKGSINNGSGAKAGSSKGELSQAVVKNYVIGGVAGVPTQELAVSHEEGVARLMRVSLVGRNGPLRIIDVTKHHGQVMSGWDMPAEGTLWYAGKDQGVVAGG